MGRKKKAKASRRRAELLYLELRQAKKQAYAEVQQTPEYRRYDALTILAGEAFEAFVTAQLDYLHTVDEPDTHAAGPCDVGSAGTS